MANFIHATGRIDFLPNDDRRFFVVDHKTRMTQFLAAGDQPSSAPLPAVAPTIDRLMSATFCPGRDPRSAEYKAGARAALAFLIEGVPMRCPFDIGTVQADAFYAGADEGRGVWSRAASHIGA